MGLIRSYIDNENGNFATMFAVCLLLLVGGAGYAIDTTNVHRQAQRYQDLADAAVLAAAGSGEETVGKLRSVAAEAVDNNNFSGETLTTSLSILEGNTLHVEVSGPRQYLFTNKFGLGRNDMVTAIAEAPPKGAGKLNLSLVLDTTASMAGTRITTLQSAANSLVDSLQSETTDEVMISVVPFARYAKISTDNAGEPWLHVQPTNLHCWDVIDEDASTGCAPDPDDEDGDLVCTSTVYMEKCETIQWWGCMASREDPWQKRAHYGGSQLVGFAGGGSCDNEILPLTNEFADVTDTIDNLITSEETYIPSGLAWGWRTLTPEAPFTEASAVSSSDRNSALVLMTDGENTRSYGGTLEGYEGVYHWEQNKAASDDLTSDLCNSIKLDGITIYTVAFEVTDIDTIALLRNCASDPSKFFDATNASALQDAFEDIGVDLAAVRLSR